MKKVIAILMFFSLNAQASMTLFCYESETPASCANKVASALEKLGCMSDKGEAACVYSLTPDPKNPGATIPSSTPYCEVASSNCSQPRTGNFGGETCLQGEKVKIARADSVHNGYWFGPFGSYSRTICIVR